MSQLDEIIDKIEKQEADEEMYFSVYFIPQHYQQAGESHE